MQSKAAVVLATGALLGLAACAPPPPAGTAAASKAALMADYQASIRDAAVAELSEIDRNLLAVRDDTPGLVWRTAAKRQLLAVTWKGGSSYEKYFKPPETGVRVAKTPPKAPRIWVTLAPQVREFCRAQSRKTRLTGDALDLRLKQYLGLSPDWSYSHFVEMWVDRRDVIRPCPDPGATDNACQLTYATPRPRVRGVAAWPGFIEDLVKKSYTPKGAPWTRLGYTYDWKHGPGGKPVERGASEFMLRPGARYEVKAASTTAAYCKPDGSE